MLSKTKLTMFTSILIVQVVSSVKLSEPKTPRSYNDSAPTQVVSSSKLRTEPKTPILKLSEPKTPNYHDPVIMTPRIGGSTVTSSYCRTPPANAVVLPYTPRNHDNDYRSRLPAANMLVTTPHMEPVTPRTRSSSSILASRLRLKQVSQPTIEGSFTDTNMQGTDSDNPESEYDEDLDSEDSVSSNDSNDRSLPNANGMQMFVTTPRIGGPVTPRTPSSILDSSNRNHSLEQQFHDFTMRPVESQPTIGEGSGPLTSDTNMVDLDSEIFDEYLDSKSVSTILTEPLQKLSLSSGPSNGEDRPSKFSMASNVSKLSESEFKKLESFKVSIASSKFSEKCKRISIHNQEISWDMKESSREINKQELMEDIIKDPSQNLEEYINKDTATVTAETDIIADAILDKRQEEIEQAIIALEEEEDLVLGEDKAYPSTCCPNAMKYMANKSSRMVFAIGKYLKKKGKRSIRRTQTLSRTVTEGAISARSTVTRTATRIYTSTVPIEMRLKTNVLEFYNYFLAESDSDKLSSLSSSDNDPTKSQKTTFTNHTNFSNISKAELLHRFTLQLRTTSKKTGERCDIAYCEAAKLQRDSVRRHNELEISRVFTELRRLASYHGKYSQQIQNAYREITKLFTSECDSMREALSMASRSGAGGSFGRGSSSPGNHNQYLAYAARAQGQVWDGTPQLVLKDAMKDTYGRERVPERYKMERPMISSLPDPTGDTVRDGYSDGDIYLPIIYLDNSNNSNELSSEFASKSYNDDGPEVSEVTYENFVPERLNPDEVIEFFKATLRSGSFVNNWVKIGRFDLRSDETSRKPLTREMIENKPGLYASRNMPMVIDKSIEKLIQEPSFQGFVKTLPFGFQRLSQNDLTFYHKDHLGLFYPLNGGYVGGHLFGDYLVDEGLQSKDYVQLQTDRPNSWKPDPSGFKLVVSIFASEGTKSQSNSGNAFIDITAMRRHLTGEFREQYQSAGSDEPIFGLQTAIDTTLFFDNESKESKGLLKEIIESDVTDSANSKDVTNLNLNGTAADPFLKYFYEKYNPESEMVEIRKVKELANTRLTPESTRSHASHSGDDNSTCSGTGDSSSNYSDADGYESCNHHRSRTNTGSTSFLSSKSRPPSSDSPFSTQNPSNHSNNTGSSLSQRQTAHGSTSSLDKKYGERFGVVDAGSRSLEGPVEIKPSPTTGAGEGETKYCYRPKLHEYLKNKRMSK